MSVIGKIIKLIYVCWCCIESSNYWCSAFTPYFVEYAPNLVPCPNSKFLGIYEMRDELLGISLQLVGGEVSPDFSYGLLRCSKYITQLPAFLMCNFAPQYTIHRSALMPHIITSMLKFRIFFRVKIC